MNEEQKQRLIKIAENKLEIILLDRFIKLESFLRNLEKSDLNKEDITSNIQELYGHNHQYTDRADYFKNYYGLEFQDLEKKYEELLPQINKYLKQE